MIWIILFIAALLFLSGCYALSEKQNVPGVFLILGGLIALILFIAIY